MLGHANILGHIVRQKKRRNSRNARRCGIPGYGIAIAGLPHAVGTDAVNVHICCEEIVVSQIAVAFFKRGAAAGHQAMAGENQVAGGFTASCGNVGIGAQRAGGLLTHQFLPVFPLANQFIGGRKVQHNFCAVEGQQRARRQGRPEILAQFNANAHTVRTQQQRGIAGNGQLRVTKAHRARFARGKGAEPSLFIKLTIGGQVGLGHNGKDAVMGECHSGIHHTGKRTDRRADHCRDAIGHLLL